MSVPPKDTVAYMRARRKLADLPASSRQAVAAQSRTTVWSLRSG